MTTDEIIAIGINNASIVTLKTAIRAVKLAQDKDQALVFLEALLRSMEGGEL